MPFLADAATKRKWVPSSGFETIGCVSRGGAYSDIGSEGRACRWRAPSERSRCPATGQPCDDLETHSAPVLVSQEADGELGRGLEVGLGNVGRVEREQLVIGGLGG